MQPPARDDAQGEPHPYVAQAMPGKGKGTKGKSAPPPKINAKGKGKSGPLRGMEGNFDAVSPVGEPKAKQRFAKAVTLKSDNEETLLLFREAECYTSEEVMDPSSIDWTHMSNLAVIKGSLEIDESLTGIVIAQVAGKLVAFRNITEGRGASPICEYFAIALNRVLNGRPSTDKIRLAEFRVVHLFSNDDEYQRIRTSMRACIQNKTGLKGLVKEDEDEDQTYWYADNPGFSDLAHDLVRVLHAFFAMHKKHAFGRQNQFKHTGRYDQSITAETVDPLDRSHFNAFTGVLEVVKGLSTMQDKMTLADEVQVNLAMGLKRDDPNYFHRKNNNPLYNNSSGVIRENMMWTLGKLTAFDALVNNMDRLNVSLLWDNKGNFTNVLVEKHTFEVVGIDQMVNPIVDLAGLDAYRKRLATLVQIVHALAQSDFEAAELEEMDSSKSAMAITHELIEFETMLETKSQSSIMGRATMASEQETRHNTANPFEWLRDIQKRIINATGVFLEVKFLAKHFVRGLADGFQSVALGGDCEAFLRKVSELVSEAFDNTTDGKLDLRGKIRQCTEFVRGNAEVIASHIGFPK